MQQALRKIQCSNILCRIFAHLMKLIARRLQIDSAALPHFRTCGSPVRTAESINKTSQQPSRKYGCNLKS